MSLLKARRRRRSLASHISTFFPLHLSMPGMHDFMRVAILGIQSQQQLCGMMSSNSHHCGIEKRHLLPAYNVQPFKSRGWQVRTLELQKGIPKMVLPHVTMSYRPSALQASSAQGRH